MSDEARQLFRRGSPVLRHRNRRVTVFRPDIADGLLSCYGTVYFIYQVKSVRYF